ncbi:MAG: hypothetical protein RLZZ04_1060 [Cyanobacteriota bacterium]|jgi:hypothetical protein
MIIRDLQHIESATETEVKGGSFYWKNVADASAEGQAFGEYTYSQANTATLTIKGQFSGAASKSISKSS